MSSQQTQSWGNRLEFILTTMSFSIGLGNTWRFPYLVYRHGGATFLVPYFLIMFILAIPTFFLEVCFGQFTGMNPIVSFRKMAPITHGLGYAAVFQTTIVTYFYCLVLTYCIYYFFFSMNSELPWSKCPDNEPSCFVNENLGNCSESIDYSNVQSPAEIYFYKKVINLTDGISDLGGMGYILPLFMLLAWTIIFFGLIKGVASLGKISYFTATVPYVIITILIIRGALLEGANIGIDFYIGSFDAKNLASADLWKDAAVQAFFSTSACSGGLIIMASFNKFDNNILRDSIIIPVMDFFTGFYAGFAIFTMLGYLYLAKCAASFDLVVAQGPELAFVVYPEGLGLMGSAAPAFSVFFFLMMLALGFGTELAAMEINTNTIIIAFSKYIKTSKQIILVRLASCLVFFGFSLFLCTYGGFYILDLLDGAVGSYPFLLVGLFEFAAIQWIYGFKKFIRDIEAMIGPKPKWFWYIVIAFWNVICPLFILVIIVTTIIATKPSTLPAHAQVIYWLVAVNPIYITGGFALYEIYQSKKKHGFINWRELIATEPDFYEKQNEHLKSVEQDEIEQDDKNSKEHAASGNKVAPVDSYEMKEKMTPVET